MSLHRSDADEMSRIFRVDYNSIVAIAIRDTMARYGRNNIGFLWAILEPMLLAVGVMVLWSFIRAPYEHGVALMAMVFTGYLPLTLWRHISSVGPNLFLRSGHFLYHGRISLMDIFLAKVLVEFVVTTAGTLLIYATLVLFGLLEPIQRWDLVIAGWLLMAYLAAAVLLFFACLTVYFEEFERFNSAIQYILLPISGCFYLMEWMPEGTRAILFWNPLVHCYEMVRDGAIGPSITTYYSAYYPILFGTVVILISIRMMPRAREMLHGQ